MRSDASKMSKWLSFIGCVLLLATIGYFLFAPRPPSPPTPPAPEQTVVVRPAEIVRFRADDAEPLGARYVAEQYLDVYYGPGTNYAEIPNASSVQMGQKLLIRDSTGIWIRVAAASTGTPEIGWINRFSSSAPPDERTDLAAYTAEVELLRAMGLVLSVEPELNSAQVDLKRWKDESLAMKRGASRSLAYYCGLTKGSNTRWVEILDDDGKILIAKYSESTGYTDFSSLRKPNSL